jgi:hypothetical protein
MKKIDRVILAVIAAALTVIALNPWVAPGYVQAQGGVMQVDIVKVDGLYLFDKDRNPRRGLPVVVMGGR